MGSELKVGSGLLVFQGFLQQLRQIAGRMSSGPRGAGLGVKLLLGAGALAYGVKEATYTGRNCFRAENTKISGHLVSEGRFSSALGLI